MNNNQINVINANLAIMAAKLKAIYAAMPNDQKQRCDEEYAPLKEKVSEMFKETLSAEDRPIFESALKM